MAKRRWVRGRRRPGVAPLLGVAMVVAIAAPLSGPGPALGAPGQPFTELAAPFTQALYGVNPGFLGGVAFAPDGDVWSNSCSFSGSPLTRFDAQDQYFDRGTTLHRRSVVPSNAGCGMANHPDGRIYSNTSEGLSVLDAATGAPVTVVGPPGNALGIAVDPQTLEVVYVGEACRSTAICPIEAHDPATGTSRRLATLPSSVASFIDGISFDPAGAYLFVAIRSPAYRLGILDRSGSVVQVVPMAHEPDGISFRGQDPRFVVTNNLDGTLTRFDFPGDDFATTPTQSTLASGGFRGDLSQVGPDGCIYLTQDGTHYLDGTTTSENSIVQICPGFAPPPGVRDTWVMVALGDSYSSGEGAPPFEDGSNYPPAIEEENTYTFGAGHNDCHRSLTNYAKIAAPTLEPDRRIVLVDRTCSGALVHPDDGASKGPIAPTDATAHRDDGQYDQAIDRLQRLHGRDADDVRLVTLTMGGNDGGFGDIVAACLIPNMAKELFRAYPDAPGEIEWIVNRFGDCGRFDGLLFDTGDRIDALPDIEREAQQGLADLFRFARILQLTYPGVVPDEDHFDGDSCGGLLRSDIDYVQRKLDDINGAIREAAGDTGAVELVDIQHRFGSNALCPADPGDALANGLDQEALVALIEDLVAPGTESRALLDDVVDEYEDFRNCVGGAVIGGPIIGPVVGFFCKGEYDDAKDAVEALGDYFTSERLNELVGRLAPGDTPALRFDNSRNLFHPNAVGFGVMACNVEAVYHHTSQQACTPSLRGVLRYLFNGVDLDGRHPTPLVPGAPVPFEFNGFDPGRPVRVRFFSDPVDLGTHVADADGVVSGQVTIPATATAGVHAIEFAGTNNASPRSVSVLGTIPGRPRAGATYGAYLCCFPADDEVAVEYLGLDWGTYWADASGGVFVEIPIGFPGEPVDVTITGTGTTTGQVVTHTVSPVPPHVGLWASATGPDALVIGGKGASIKAWMHSDGAVVVRANGVKLDGGVEYATTFDVLGKGGRVDPSPVQRAPGGVPVTVDLADWRPGGSVAAGLGAAYQIVPAGACTGGTWRPVAGDIVGDVVYVPCNLELGTSLSARATLVVEGSVAVTASGVHLTATDARFGLLAAGDIVVARPSFQVGSPIWTAGDLVVDGRAVRLPCGVYAQRIHLNAPGARVASCPGAG